MKERKEKLIIPANDHDTESKNTNNTKKRRKLNNTKTKKNTLLCQVSFFFFGLYILYFLFAYKYHQIDVGLLIKQGKIQDLKSSFLIKRKAESKTEKENEKKKKSNYILTAYMEKIDQTEWKRKPLPIRKNARAHLLKKRTFPNVKSCQNLQAQFPIDDSEYPEEDSFLPWIHDVFPSANGEEIQFVAQNKRRCHVGDERHFQHPFQNKTYTQPQISLFQHIPIKRLKNASSSTNNDDEYTYQIANFDEADEDGQETRFICRFKPSNKETLSKFRFNYEYVGWRRRPNFSVFREDALDYNNLWNSQLMFSCPVPKELQEIVKSGSSIINDYATLFVDLIPIRTPPRYGLPGEFLPPKYEVPNTLNFSQVYGSDHILPTIRDSGRWENIPICQSTPQTFGITKKDSPTFSSTSNDKEYQLVACTWAANNYKTRKSMSVPDGERRLKEWITFHLLSGFDHIVVYDNTGAFDKNSSGLSNITNAFPKEQVTRIDWSAKVCNNNPNNVNDRGERSSQYAAESSCLTRFGPHTKWMTTLDIDEYLVPVGNYTNMKDVLAKVEQEGTQVYGFRSFRTRPIFRRLETPNIVPCRRNSKCFQPIVPKNSTFLYSYNCDVEKPSHEGKKIVNPAEKEIYRTDFVLLHFIHFSSVTTNMVLSQSESRAKGFGWDRYFRDKHRKKRLTDELSEATMIHTKAVPFDQTYDFDKICKEKKHYFGFPWPNNEETNITIKDYEGYLYNCFINDPVDKYWVPKLHQALGIPY